MENVQLLGISISNIPYCQLVKSVRVKFGLFSPRKMSGDCLKIIDVMLKCYLSKIYMYIVWCFHLHAISDLCSDAL